MEDSGTLLDVIAKVIATLNDYIWGWPLVIVLLCTHIYLTWRLKFIQLFLKEGIKLTFARDKDAPGDLSHFGSFCIALAATFGTGNIIGVATAIALGGRARSSGCGSPACSASPPSTRNAFWP